MMPNYKQIFTDILNQKFPHKKEFCKNILSKANITQLDVIKLNQIIFESKPKISTTNQKFRAYNKSTIVRILQYQAQNQLSNTQIANHFNLSRNTISKWRKQFEIN